MIDVTGKRLLVLGGNYSTVEVVRLAKSMGIYALVASNEESGKAKEIADEKVLLNTGDIDAVVQYIKDNRIDGVMTGASEFHLHNMIRICKKAGLPCYCNEEQWNLCQNKYAFKELCAEYGVPHVPFWEDLEEVPENAYPVIVKPIDGCSARGITVCENKEELMAAIPHALEYSPSKKIIIEKFIINQGVTQSVRYVAADGELYCEAVGDRYVLNAEKGKALITASAFYPSKLTENYLHGIDEKVQRMYKGIGLRNGALFMEAITNDEDGLMFYEMGLRISGGMTYKITEITNDVNELRMLIRYAVSGSMCDEEEKSRISPWLNGYATGSITFPLTQGTIREIRGVKEVKAISEVSNLVQYYFEGDTLEEKHMSTLDQLFCRVSIIAKSKARLVEVVEEVKNHISVIGSDGQEMIIEKRLEEIMEDYLGKSN